MSERKSHIPIRDSENNDCTIYFPIPEDSCFTLDDLRSAFPNASSMRYKDGTDDNLHHILCRNDVFVEPSDGWHVDGRMYLVVGSLSASSASRFGLFQSYRRLSSQQGTSKSSSNKAEKAESTDKKKMSGTTLVTVGHGQFRRDGQFGKITSSGLSGCGGLVTVGPVSKCGNTAEEIKKKAFEKFHQLNRSFRSKYKSHTCFYLVYPDGTLVDQLPGSFEEFSILGYRNYIDPNKRFDRLRLFLCAKHNYDANNSVEILTDSDSSSELPPLTFNARQLDTSLNSTLPLTVAVSFYYQEEHVDETFPNNTQGSVLIQFAKERFNIQNIAVITLDGTLIKNEDRLLEITSNDRVTVKVETSSTAEITREEREISAEYEKDEESVKVADNLVKQTINELNGSTEPTLILRMFRDTYLQGRQLDIEDDNNYIDGDVSSLCVRRTELFKDALEEMPYVRNIRFPLHITFVAEEADDFGGPRREFLKDFLRHFKQNLLIEENGTIKFRNSDQAIAKHYYFHSGLLIGLSTIEGGPLLQELWDLLQSSNGEAKDQFVRGLKRTGIYQLLEKVSTVKFLFLGGSQVLTTKKLLSLLSPVFSLEGSNRRMKEEAAYRNFVKYLREVNAGRRGNVTLEKILEFTTGAAEEPILGFAKTPSIEFTEGEVFLPTANTCICRLTLPMDSIEHDMFDLAFMNEYFGFK